MAESNLRLGDMASRELLNLGRLLRTSRNSLGPLRSRRLRRCRSSSVADGSLRRSISWPAIVRAFAAPSVRTAARWALGPCSVAMIDLHSSQTMSAASWHQLATNYFAQRLKAPRQDCARGRTEGSI